MAAKFDYLHKLFDKSYTLDMSNVTHITATESAQHAQAAHLWGLLEAERWTFRKLEARTGMKVGVISSRMRGVTPLTIAEVQVFADVLHRDPVSLYAELLGRGTEPSPEDSNPRTLVPKVAGSIPVGGTLINFPTRKTSHTTRERLAPVTSITAAAR